MAILSLTDEGRNSTTRGVVASNPTDQRRLELNHEANRHNINGSIIKVNSQSAKFLEIHLEMEHVDL